MSTVGKVRWEERVSWGRMGENVEDKAVVGWKWDGVVS